MKRKKKNLNIQTNEDELILNTESKELQQTDNAIIVTWRDNGWTFINTDSKEKILTDIMRGEPEIAGISYRGKSNEEINNALIKNFGKEDAELIKTSHHQELLHLRYKIIAAGAGCSFNSPLATRIISQRPEFVFRKTNLYQKNGSIFYKSTFSASRIQDLNFDLLSFTLPLPIKVTTVFILTKIGFKLSSIKVNHPFYKKLLFSHNISPEISFRDLTLWSHERWKEKFFQKKQKLSLMTNPSLYTVFETILDGTNRAATFLGKPTCIEILRAIMTADYATCKEKKNHCQEFNSYYQTYIRKLPIKQNIVTFLAFCSVATAGALIYTGIITSLSIFTGGFALLAFIGIIISFKLQQQKNELEKKIHLLTCLIKTIDLFLKINNADNGYSLTTKAPAPDSKNINTGEPPSCPSPSLASSWR